MNLIVTNACNLNCTYCYEGSKDRKYMTNDIGKEAIDFFISQSLGNSNLNLNFHGGEPLLNFELIKYSINYLKAKSPDIYDKSNFSLTTNGTVINKEMCEFFFDNKFKINVSLDGKKEVHDLNRKTHGKENTFDIIMNSIDLLEKYKCDFTIRMTIAPNNIEYLSESIKWLIQQGFKKIRIGIDIFSNWDSKLHILESEIYKVKDLYIEQAVEDRSFIDIFDGKYSGYLVDGKALFCNGGFGGFTINTQGNIYPCVYVFDDDEFCFGNVKSGIDNEKRKGSIAKYAAKDNKCGDCKIKCFCLGRRCWYLNYATTGFLTVTCDILCKFENLLYKVVGEVVDELYKKNDPNLLRMLQIIQNNDNLIPNKKIEKYILKEESYV